MSARERLRALGISLPPPAAPVGAYSTWVRSADLIFLSGHLCKRDGAVVTGMVGPGGDHDTAAAAELARLCALELLATIDAAIGLDAVSHVVKLTGFVASTASFTEQSTVVNGASELLVAAFGSDSGRHARSAVGVAQLPLGAAVEIEAIIEVG